MVTGLVSGPAEPRGLTQPGYTAATAAPALRPGLLPRTDPTSARAPPTPSVGTEAGDVFYLSLSS